MPSEFGETASRLSEIVTNWPDVFDAGKGGMGARNAQERLILRYAPAIRRYLLILVGDREGAEELFQEFSALLVAGKFRAAVPERGKFRNYVKTILVHLARRRRRQKCHQPLTLDGEQLQALVGHPEVDESDATFNKLWCDNLLGQAFRRLEETERVTGTLYHTALELKIRHPEKRSAELAEQLAEKSQRPMTASAYRRLIMHARVLLSENIVRQVEDSLDRPGLDAVEEELIDLRLMNVCRKVIERRRSTRSV
jgi:DNA-directed RNA polymerase specialized sigma24 family protein